jgi:hypothetical protein
MTLIVSEVSKFGVVMVADSAITTQQSDILPSGQQVPLYVRLGAAKVKQVPGKPIGTSFWGMGRIANIPTDIWLDDFFSNRIKPESTLEEICNILAEDVNESFFRHNQNDIGGFHIGSIISDTKNNTLPVLYHIHRGHEGQTPGKFELHKDYPNEHILKKENYYQNLKQGNRYFLRNGLHSAFANVQERIFQSIYALSQQNGINIPYPLSLKTLENLNRLIVGLLCDLIAISDNLEKVARPISSLTIDLKGNVTFTSALSNVSYT